ncbi:sulfurtransferase complex subunit TusC [Buchnera aphidicola]|uniref:sulfurtransferase complex subunit TusC n=1 Tax=Buchnera aphidicola TaxID=9 RepID=UPI0034646AA5
MKTTVAVIFSHAPYGNVIGEEGLNLAISLTSYIQKIGIFFLSDGIFQIYKKKITEKSYFSDYSHKFKMLFFLGVKNYYCEKSSLKNRGILNLKNFFLKVKVLNTKKFMKKVNAFNHILTF